VYARRAIQGVKVAVRREWATGGFVMKFYPINRVS